MATVLDPSGKCPTQFEEWSILKRRLQGEASIMGWSGKIRVNGTTYKWVGMDGTGTPANVTNVQITPTQTIFVMRAGPMNVTVTYLSPVEVCGSPVRLAYSRSQQGGDATSPTTGSSSRFRFPMCLWKPNPSMEIAILCKCTLTSAQVCHSASSRPGFFVYIILVEWASGDRSSQVKWSNANTDTGNAIYH